MRKKSTHKLFGIIGCPVKHSLSPYMHNAAFKRLKIKAAYLPFSVKRGRLKETIFSFRENGISGFNVTIPFKSECMRYLDKIEPTARIIGAVNTVVVRDKRFIGYNTDCLGFIRSLKEELKVNPKGRTVLILGAGGAARAVAFGLAEEGAGHIYIYDIIKSKALSLTRNIKKNFPRCGVYYCRQKDIKENISKCHLLVNCTPLGMKKTDPLPISPAFLYRRLKIYDIVYTPLHTRLVKTARAKGIKAVGGIGMLLYQGVVAFELWTGRRAPVSLMRKELLEHI